MQFGLFDQLPENFDIDNDAAWGARAIVEENYGYKVWLRTMKGREPLPFNVSLLHDRQSVKGSNEETVKALARELNKGPLKKALKRAEHLFADGTWSEGRMSEGVQTLYDKDGLVIKGNPRRSSGYLYLVAYRDK